MTSSCSDGARRRRRGGGDRHGGVGQGDVGGGGGRVPPRCEDADIEVLGVSGIVVVGNVRWGQGQGGPRGDVPPYAVPACGVRAMDRACVQGIKTK